MYQQQAILRQQRARRARRNRDVGMPGASKTLGPVTTTLFLVVIVGVLSLLYLTQVTKTSSLDYQISDLNQKQEKLLQEQQKLQVEAARLRSVGRVENSGVAAELEPETNVTYGR
jgi:cell division protein FtsL